MRKSVVFFILLTLIATNNFSECYGAEDAYATKIPVLLYHHLLYDEENRNKENGAIVSVENFTQQMRYLKDNDYTTITIEQLYDFLYNDEALPPKSILITFDDGYLSNYRYAYHILKEYGFKASIFIITDVISDKERVFFPNALTMLDRISMEASEDVFSYYSHTDTFHGSVRGVSGFTFHDKDLVAADTLKSFESVKSLLAFAYPLGMYNDTVIEILTELGVRLAFTTERGYVTPSSNPYQLPRLIISPTHTLQDFKSLIQEE